MTDDGEPSGAPGSGRVPPKVGWYRDRKSGQRRFWNGAAWVDLADAITPLTIESEPAPEVPPPPPIGRGRATNTRTKVIAVTAFVVVVAVVAVALDVSHGANAPPSHPQLSQAPPHTPLPPLRWRRQPPHRVRQQQPPLQPPLLQPSLL